MSSKKNQLDILYNKKILFSYPYTSTTTLGDLKKNISEKYFLNLDDIILLQNNNLLKDDKTKISALINNSKKIEMKNIISKFKFCQMENESNFFDLDVDIIDTTIEQFHTLVSTFFKQKMDEFNFNISHFEFFDENKPFFDSNKIFHLHFKEKYKQPKFYFLIKDCAMHFNIKNYIEEKFDEEIKDINTIEEKKEISLRQNVESGKTFKIIIQTYNPDNYAIEFSKKQDYKSFYDTELPIRKTLKYPPFCDIIVIDMSAKNIQELKVVANRLHSYLKERVINEKFGLLLYSPVPSPIDKIKDRYRYRMIIKCLYDDRVNDSMPENKLYIPYENIVYIGDSATDIPCMRLVKSKGGYSIGVFDPEKDIRQKVYQLFNDERINYYAPADYSSRSELSKYVKQIIDTVAAKEKMKTDQMVLNVDADLFKSIKALEQMYDLAKQQTPKKMKKDMKKNGFEIVQAEKVTTFIYAIVGKK